MSNLPNIGHVRQWAMSHAPDGTVLDAVAAFVLAALDGTGLPAGCLAAIQRSFMPIDDAGTLRMEVNRFDVEALLAEVVRLSAANTNWTFTVKAPLIEVASISYTDAAGQTQVIGGDEPTTIRDTDNGEIGGE